MRKIHIFLFAVILSCNSNREERTFFYSGKIQSVYIKNKNGFYHGTCYDYYENGNKKYETKYIEGRIDGVRKTYYSNGNLKIQATYKSGLHNGFSVGYSEIKELDFIDYYINDTIIYQLEFRNNKLIDWSQIIDLNIAKDTVKTGECQSINTCLRSTFIDGRILLKIYITKELTKNKLILVNYFEKKYNSPEIVKYKTIKLTEPGNYFVHVKYFTMYNEFIFCGYILFCVV